MMFPDFTVAVLGVTFLIVVAVCYGIAASSYNTSEERRTRHEEFKARLGPEHEEKMAKIVAERDAIFAKYGNNPLRPVTEQPRIVNHGEE